MGKYTMLRLRNCVQSFNGLCDVPCVWVIIAASPFRASIASKSGQEKSSVSGKGGRVVKCTGLENRQRRKSLVGSNPTPSATNEKPRKCRGFS